ncbi:MAG: DoxX family protein [Balneolaceae bacterium]|nr:DoxX family protein [Balneolaceae bacterium]
MANLDSKYSDIALLLLRLGIGIIFIVAGWGKLTGIEGVQGFFGDIGIPLPGIMAWVVAIVEFFGGIMVVLGAYAKIPYLLLAIIMVVAIFTVKIDQGFGATRLELMLLLASLALFLTGSGQHSVDHKMATR